MPNLFHRISGTGTATLFEIRLDSDFIVLRGEENEASSQMLKGSVVLCLPHALKVEDVHLRMIGQLKVGWNDQRITPTGISNNRVDRNTEIFSHRWPPFVGGQGTGSSSKGMTLPAGNYEWPFELVIPGSMAESIEGLPDSHIVYKLKATVARGKLAYDLHAWKPVRIVRTLDPSALELAHAMTVENIWPNKIEYQLVIPQKAIVFGTAIDVEMRFTSLLKGLRIGTIKCQLVETHELTVSATPGHPERLWKATRDIETWTFELNDNHYQEMLDENGQDGYTLKEVMPLPKKLQKCVQDVDTHGIKIRHKVKFNIALHNPDGHISELRATLPVTIFISPNMPMGSDGCLLDQTPLSTQSVDVAHHAPPLYGEHVLDQLYADMDNSGLMTPAPQSGMNTPFYAQSMSRAGSHENLASLTQEAHPNGAVPPSLLSSRLQNLNSHSRSNSRRMYGQGSGSNTPLPHSLPEDGYFDQHASDSGTNSNVLSRRTSEEENHVSNGASGYQTPIEPSHPDHSAYSASLSKVPSYTTALKSPSRGLSYNNTLPDYEAATSAPPSPVHRHATLAQTFGMAGVGFTPLHSPPAQGHGHSDLEEARRLQLLRNR